VEEKHIISISKENEMKNTENHKCQGFKSFLELNNSIKSNIPIYEKFNDNSLNEKLDIYFNSNHLFSITQNDLLYSTEIDSYSRNGNKLNDI